jgi:hypothetical protein
MSDPATDGAAFAESVDPDELVSHAAASARSDVAASFKKAFDFILFFSG